MTTLNLQTEAVISSTSDCTEKRQKNLLLDHPRSPFSVWVCAAVIATFVLLQKVMTDPQATETKRKFNMRDKRRLLFFFFLFLNNAEGLKRKMN